MAGITDIDYSKLFLWLLPPRLRKSKMISWTKALNTPVHTLYLGFKAWERESWYLLRYQTGQVAYLEFVLNDKFDPVQKRIYISGGNQADRLYIWQDSELQQPVWLHTDSEGQPVWLFTDAELAIGWSDDFTINVPYGLAAEDATIKATADRFKRDGKSYAYVKF